MIIPNTNVKLGTISLSMYSANNKGLKTCSLAYDKANMWSLVKPRSLSLDLYHSSAPQDIANYYDYREGKQNIGWIYSGILYGNYKLGDFRGYNTVGYERYYDGVEKTPYVTIQTNGNRVNSFQFGVSQNDSLTDKVWFKNCWFKNYYPGILYKKMNTSTYYIITSTSPLSMIGAFLNRQDPAIREADTNPGIYFPPSLKGSWYMYPVFSSIQYPGSYFTGWIPSLVSAGTVMYIMPRLYRHVLLV